MSMLELLHSAGSVLSQADNSGTSDGFLVAAAEIVDGTVTVARCRGDRQSLDIFRISGHARGLETIEAGKPIAAGDVMATTLAWLPVGPRGQLLLCIGFSHGGISIFTPKGAVCLSMVLVQRPLLRFRMIAADESGNKSAVTITASDRQWPPDDRLMAFHEGGSVAVVLLESLHAALLGGPSSDPRETDMEFRFLLYELRGREVTNDVCLVDGLSALDDVFATNTSSGVIALGSKPFLSMHKLSEDKAGTRSIVGVAAQALGSYARSWVPFRKNAGFDPITAPPQRSAGMLDAQDIQVPPRTKSDEIAVSMKFIDPSREGACLEPAPPARYSANQSSIVKLAASCDNFGRVALLCLETLRCLHLWKGYRDAQVAWLQPSRGQNSMSTNGGAGSCGDLGLVIYAPRRGLLELWDVGDPLGPRRADAAAVDLDGKLLSAGRGQVHLLRKSGRLDRVRWRHVPVATNTSAASQRASGSPASATTAASDQQAAPATCMPPTVEDDTSPAVETDGAKPTAVASEPGSDDFGSAGSDDGRAADAADNAEVATSSDHPTADTTSVVKPGSSDIDLASAASDNAKLSAGEGVPAAAATCPGEPS